MKAEKNNYHEIIVNNSLKLLLSLVIFTFPFTSLTFAQTTQISPDVYQIESGVEFNISNFGDIHYLFSWTDTNGEFVEIVDPTLNLSAGQTYTFKRISSGNPFRITDETLPVAGSDGLFQRITASITEIDGATLKPIDAFQADPAPTSDVITWTPQVGNYYYTSTVSGHLSMTGAIQVKQFVYDIVEKAIRTDIFSTLVTAVGAADLVDVLKSDGPFTVFAPTNDAFNALPDGTLESLLLPENKNQLISILLYHVVPGDVASSEVVNLNSAETATSNQQLVYFSVEEGNVKINNSNIIATDIDATNGVIHVIDSVLIPEVLPNVVETAINAGTFNTLVAALQATGLDSTLGGDGPFTVFAPSDEAFAQLPSGILESLLLEENLSTLTQILTYHVAADKLISSDVVSATEINTVNGLPVTVSTGETVQINSSTITAVDVDASNGVIHVIGSVLLPDNIELPMPLPTPTATPQPVPNIVDTAASVDIFSTLVTALEASGLVETLMGDGPFTVFAPTNDAFNALPEGTLDSLLLPENLDQLINILLYHVVPGEVASSEVVNLNSAETATGNQQLVIFSVNEGNVKINESNIIDTDIQASNGIIHVIDSVLIPEELTNIVETAVSAGTFNTLVAALQATGLDSILSGDGPFTVFAPSDEAFDQLPAGLLEALLLEENQNLLTQILTYHVVSDQLISSEVINSTDLVTVNGESVAISVNDSVLVNDSAITAVDIDASNGVIHVIDRVLVPSNIELPLVPTPTPTVTPTPPAPTSTPEPVPTSTPTPPVVVLNNIVDTASSVDIFSTLVAAVDAADLVDVLKSEGPFTVFAPTNDAFNALPEGTVEFLLQPENKEQLINILLYHVLPGEFGSGDVSGISTAETATQNQQLVTFTVTEDGVLVNNANIIDPDIQASNGIIHAIDSVLITQDLNNIVETAIEAGTFETLVTALQITGLDEVLRGEGPFTVFAPSDEVFESIPSELLDALLLEENRDLLIQILTYHVVPDKVISSEVINANELQTVNGLPISITTTENSVLVDQISVSATDIDASNGVIHVIDGILIPENVELPSIVPTSTPIPVVTATPTPEPVMTPTPTPEPGEIAVSVYDDPNSMLDLTGQTDFDSVDNRNITISTNAPIGSAADWHFYVKDSLGGMKFLGRSGDGTVQSINWRPNESTLSPEFINGPSFNSVYTFQVVRIDDQLTHDDFIEQEMPVGFNLEGSQEVSLVNPEQPNLNAGDIYVTDDILGLSNLAPAGESGMDEDPINSRAIQVAWNFGIDEATIHEYHIYVSVNGEDFQYLGQTLSSDTNYFWWTPLNRFSTASDFVNGPEGGNTYQFLVYLIPLEGPVQSILSGTLDYSTF